LLIMVLIIFNAYTFLLGIVTAVLTGRDCHSITKGAEKMQQIYNLHNNFLEVKECDVDCLCNSQLLCFVFSVLVMRVCSYFIIDCSLINYNV
uniref:Uncharacterized protein n=1 Tax=Sinocyclocheilus anshuiensis TaxID=1608454 RepID=A0A671MU04_9TELE